MERNIVQIGNSMGVILPSHILKRLNLAVKDQVFVTLEDNSIIIKPVPRRNWEAAAKEMHAAGDGELLIPDVFEDEDMEEIEWNK
nr:AbrB/MazE/SpoVT family DNA-binding domain-containing protein [Parabacteroides goldsteinii]